MNPAQALLIGILAGAVGPAALYFWCRHFIVKMISEIRESGICPVCAQVNATLKNAIASHRFAHDASFPPYPPACPWTTEGDPGVCGKPGTHKIPPFLEYDRIDGDTLCLSHFEELLEEENEKNEKNEKYEAPRS